MTERSTPPRVAIGLVPYLTVKGAKAAVEFYARAFAAREIFRQPADDGERLLHARLEINGSAVMLSDDFPEYRGGQAAPAPAGVTLHLQVDDADAWWNRAVEAGATVTMPIADQFWGDRYGHLKDPFGHSWSIGAPIKR
jgi:PhnB protein